MPVIIVEQEGEEEHDNCCDHEEKEEHHHHHHCEEPHVHHHHEEEDCHIINNLLLHKTIDLATISTYNNSTSNISVFNCKLVPIHIKFNAFSILFFKQKCHRKSGLDTRFINILFNKIKPPLLQKITQQYTLSCKNNTLYKSDR